MSAAANHNPSPYAAPSHRLTLVTTRPAEAVSRLLGVDASPLWLRIISEPRLVAGIVDGSRCIAVFFEARRRRSSLEWAWIERRKRGGIVGLDMAALDGLAAWQARIGADSAAGHAAPAVAGLPASIRQPLAHDNTSARGRA